MYLCGSQLLHHSTLALNCILIHSLCLIKSLLFIKLLYSKYCLSVSQPGSEETKIIKLKNYRQGLKFKDKRDGDASTIVPMLCGTGRNTVSERQKEERPPGGGSN